MCLSSCLEAWITPAQSPAVVSPQGECAVLNEGVYLKADGKHKLPYCAKNASIMKMTERLKDYSRWNNRDSVFDFSIDSVFHLDHRARMLWKLLE